MKILIAPDKFKGSLTAPQVCEIISATLLARKSNFQISTLPLADGGEGTAELLTHFSQGSEISVDVLDPLLRPIQASYGLSFNKDVAFIEMAKASGLQLLKLTERNCIITSTYGTGQLIKHALDKGVTQIVMGVGGSATNDAGMGMARALGIKLCDKDGNELKGTGADLNYLHEVYFTSMHPSVSTTTFIVLTDVSNPFDGEDGAACVFAKQKGAGPTEINTLNKGLENFRKLASSKKCDLNFPGAGAAGGLGGGAKFFLNAVVRNGMEFIAEFTGLEKMIKEADVVITGEGKIDAQTLSGKVVKGVAELCRIHKKKLLLVAGHCELDEQQIKMLGASQLITLKDKSTSTEEAMQQAKEILAEKIQLLKL